MCIRGSHRCDALAEGFGLRLIAAQDDVVQAGLADDGHCLTEAYAVDEVSLTHFIGIKPFGHPRRGAEAQDVYKRQVVALPINVEPGLFTSPRLIDKGKMVDFDVPLNGIIGLQMCIRDRL